jgi:ParB family chromosome partitioning protein
MSKNRGLGRGFDALIPTDLEVDAAVAAATGTAAVGDAVRQLNPAKIQPNPHQPRLHFDEEELRGLAASIKEHGLLQPLVASETGDGAYELIAGERRLRAAKIAGLETVPVLIRSFDEQQKMELALIENLQRVELNPIETAVAYKKLADEFNLSLDQIGERMGKAKSTVSNVIRLLQLPPEMREAVGAGRISEAHGRNLLAVEDPALRQELFTTIQEQGLTVRQAEEFARRAKAASNAEPSKGGGRPTKAVAPGDTHITEALSQKLHTKVFQQTTSKGGRLVIEYHSDEELERIFEAIKSAPYSG